MHELFVAALVKAQTRQREIRVLTNAATMSPALSAANPARAASIQRREVESPLPDSWRPPPRQPAEQKGRVPSPAAFHEQARDVFRAQLSHEPTKINPGRESRVESRGPDCRCHQHVHSF